MWGTEIRAPWGKQGPAVRQSQGVAIGLLQPFRASLQVANAWCSFSTFWARWSAHGNILSVILEDGGGCLQAPTKSFNPGTGCFLCLCFNQGEDLFTDASPSPSVPLLQLKKNSHKAEQEPFSFMKICTIGSATAVGFRNLLLEIPLTGNSSPFHSADLEQVDRLPVPLLSRLPFQVVA